MDKYFGFVYCSKKCIMNHLVWFLRFIDRNSFVQNIVPKNFTVYFFTITDFFYKDILLFLLCKQESVEIRLNVFHLFIYS